MKTPKFNYDKIDLIKVKENTINSVLNSNDIQYTEKKLNEFIKDLFHNVKEYEKAFDEFSNLRENGNFAENFRKVLVFEKEFELSFFTQKIAKDIEFNKIKEKYKIFEKAIEQKEISFKSRIELQTIKDDLQKIDKTKQETKILDELTDFYTRIKSINEKVKTFENEYKNILSVIHEIEQDKTMFDERLQGIKL